MKGEELEREEHSECDRAGQRNRNIPKRYAKHPASEDTAPRNDLYSRGSRGVGFLAAELLGQNDRLGQLLHRTAQPAAFIAHPQVRFFLGEILAALQDALGALHHLAGFQLPLDLGGLFGQARVLFFQQALGDGAAHLLAHELDGGNLLGGVRVPLAMMHVDHADDLALVDQRHREEGLVGILHQRGKEFEPRIGGGFRGKRHGRLVLGHPAGDPLADFHAQISQVRGVRNLRRAQHEFLRGHFHQVDQAGIASRDLGRKAHDLPKHLIQRQFGADNPAYTVQDRDFLRLLPFHFVQWPSYY